MKIAIALFGIPRASAVTMPSIERCFIEPASRLGECQVFYHLFKLDHLINQRSGENSVLDSANYNWFEQYSGRLESPDYCLKLWDFDWLKTFGDFHNDNFSSLKNLVHQLHSLNEVTRMVRQHDADIVLFLRPDLFYKSPIQTKDLLRLYADPRRCIIPQWEWWNGYSDRFAFCGKESYSTYGTRLMQVSAFCHELGEALQGERLVRYALKKSNAKTRLTSLQASRVRVTGAFEKEYFSPFYSIWRREVRREWVYLKLLSSLGL